tara:strand:+ start:54 stop:407 length:354 start_codon:yes stop_codon:yes gene_type:complete
MAMFCYLRSNEGKIKVNKVGFSFFAFIFSFIWAFSYKIYRYALFSFIILISNYLFYLYSLINLNMFILVCLLSSIFWGVFGNNILICNLINCGFYPKKLISSKNSQEALMIILSNDG